MRIAMVSAESEPFAKTGGLADVVDALARALGRLGHEVDVYLPRYRGVPVPDGAQRSELYVPVGQPGGVANATAAPGRAATAHVGLLTAAADGYHVRFVDHPPSFDRPDFYVDPETRRDWPDNAARFALLGRTALETLRMEGRPVDILHGHDWQAGPALLLLRHRYGDDRLLGGLPTLLSCHNLAYHGWTPRAEAWQLDLPSSVGAPDGVDLLREGVAVAELVNTVSPTYARESTTPEYGGGLDDLLRARGDRYLGILNGLDLDLWDPATDADLPARFDADDPSGKADCKRDLCERLRLSWAEPGEPWGAHGAPLFGLVGRLDPQKGFDLLTDAAAELVALGVRLVVLGTGDRSLVDGLRELAEAHPDRIALLERFDRAEARRIYAASDVFLMPSRFEPCGQGQMIALRYGTLPLVRRTGGLADTIVDADGDALAGNGFVFEPAEPAALLEAARRAVNAYHDRPRWAELVRRGMADAVGFAWERGSAPRYVAAYERAIALRAGGGPGAAS
ncbi:MAG TPA: glycogen/starch synthase [Candidatus Limnocylindrales bacterium]|nr:glycogen/starch synthase [Candidatus Limnocylindrales bacterium]